MAWLAIAVPLALTLGRAATESQWRDDIAIIRALGLVPLGGEGALSAALGLLASIVPVGGKILRVTAVGALAAGLGGYAVYRLVRQLLPGRATVLGPLLALGAALSAILSASWQLEATVAGGAALASALVLVLLLLEPGRDSAPSWCAGGALIGLSALESHVAGGAALAGFVAALAATGRLPNRNMVLLGTGSMLLVLAIGLTPLVIRPLGAHGWVDLGVTASGQLSGIDLAAEMAPAYQVWLTELGPLALVFASVGGVWALLRGQRRWLMATFGVWLAADALWPAAHVSVVSPDALAPLRLLAIAGLAILSACGVVALIRATAWVGPNLRTAAAALLVALFWTTALVATEESARVAERRSAAATETWTDEVARTLPHRAVLLVKSEPVAWRLWTAQLVRGERPDVVVVPMPLLGHGSVAAHLLDLEPALAPLIRQVAVEGKPGEHALSSLADARPLVLELETHWDQRLAEHLAPHPFFMRFAPHALGRSDRMIHLDDSLESFRRVARASQHQGQQDVATRAVLKLRAFEQAVALGVLGDREAALKIVAELRVLDPHHQPTLDLERRLTQEKGARIELGELLHE